MPLKPPTAQDALLSVKEFSRITGIPASTLRYYDNIGLFKPVRRGGNDYRYYSPYQMLALNFIFVLTGVDIPLNLIKKNAINREPSSIVQMLEAQDKAFEKQIDKLQEARDILRTFRRNIETGLAADVESIKVERYDETAITLGKYNDWGEETDETNTNAASSAIDEPNDFFPPFIEFLRQMMKHGANIIYPVGGYFDNFNVFSQEQSHPDRFYLADPKGSYKIPAGDYITAYAKGYYGQMQDAPTRIARFANERGIKTTGPVYVLYLIDEVSTADPSAYLARIRVKVGG